MKKESLKLQELKIDRMPGFPRGLRTYRGFSPYINIIAGPNASGKSSTARAIQKLIWRKLTGGFQIDGKINIGGETWSVRIDSDYHTIQRDGMEAELTGLPSPDDKNRYVLALHELVQDKADEGDLAKQIIKESIGGYDIDLAKENLSYAPGIRTQNVSEFKNLREAKQIVRKQEQNQQQIKKKEEQLEGLYHEKEKAEQAVKQKGLYDIILQYLEIKESLEQLKGELNQYPEALANAHGDIYNNIVTLEEERGEAKRRQEESRNIVEELRNKLKDLQIPDKGIHDIDLFELEQRIEKLTVLEQQQQELKDDIRNCVKRKEKAYVNLAGSESEIEWNGLNLKGVGELEQFLERAHRTASTKKFLETEIEELQDEAPNTEDSRRIQDGLGYLSSWLQEPAGIAVLPNWIFWLMIVFTLAAAVLTVLMGTSGVAALIVVFGIAVYALKKNSGRKSRNQWQRRQQGEFEELGLKPPGTWDVENVRRRLKELVEELQQAEWQKRIQYEREKRTSQLKKLESEISKVKDEAATLKNQLGALPELPFELPQSYTALTWFLIQAQRWQQASEEEAALGSQMEGLREDLQITLDRCNKLFEQYNLEPASDVAQAVARLKLLKKQEEKRKYAIDQIKAEERTINEQQKLVDDRTGQLQNLYSKMNVEFGNTDQVKLLVDQLEDYHEVVSKYRVTERELLRKRELMEKHSMYKNHKKRIEGYPLNEVKAVCENLKDKAEGLEQVNTEIYDIEAKVNALQDGSSLENALAQKEEALLELKSLYEKNISSIAGDIIVAHVKKVIREQNRPKVFEEANTFFNRITKGKYEIRVDEKTEEFIAYDTVAGISKNLNKLSTGTRIQLLISVRLAFVETKESVIKLPILADELLANSDDIRAKAIIEALIEISREGRQVFYFTAQADEVAKWNTFLSDDPEIGYEIYELLEAGQEGSGYLSEGKKIDLPGFIHDIPGADGRSYEEYGNVLDVNSFNMLVHNISEIHLWYLLDDPELLQRCLMHGLQRWGALKSYLKHGGRIEGIDQDQLALLEEKIRLMEQFQNDYLKGRPRPIDRNILETSGAISDAFIHEVSEKLEEVDRNPELLLEALRSGEISGFRSNKIEELENYLVENGYIDTREKLTIEEIHTRLQAVISGMQISPDEAQTFMGRVLQK